MPRTKGALNKKKQIKDEAKAKVEKEIKAVQEDITLPVVFPNALGVTKEEIHAVKRICFECPHNKDMHYGGVKGHCNTPNCPCLEFK